MFPSFNARAAGLDLAAVETIQLAAEAGFQGVDLMVRDLVEAGDDPAELRARMEDRGLRGGTFALPVHWRGSDEEFERDLARLPVYARAAATLGVNRTGTWILPETASQADDFATTAAWHRARLGRIARVLQTEGIALGLEVIGVASARTGRGVPFVSCLADLDRALGSLFLDATNVGLIVDAWHLYAADEPIEAALAWGIKRVVSVHLADLPALALADRTTMRDQHRGLPGEHGAIDARPLLRRLDALGHDGPVIAEPLGNCQGLAGLSPRHAAQRIASALRAVWPHVAGAL